MNTLNFADLDASELLDRQSMAVLIGSGSWDLVSTSTVYGPWSPYKKQWAVYQGTVMHDNYLSRWTYEHFTRTRTATEYSYWNHYVTV